MHKAPPYRHMNRVHVDNFFCNIQGYNRINTEVEAMASLFTFNLSISFDYIYLAEIITNNNNYPGNYTAGTER